MDLRTEIIDDVLVVELPKTGIKITGCEIVRRKVKSKTDTIMLVNFSGVKRSFQLPAGKWELAGSLAEYQKPVAGSWHPSTTFILENIEYSY